MRAAFFLCTLSAASSLFEAAHAQDAYTADIMAQGRAAVAHPTDPSTATVNPANIAITDRYDIYAGFQGGPEKEWRWQAAAIDGRTTKFLTYGLVYHGEIAFPQFAPAEWPGWAPVSDIPVNKIQRHDITFAVATAFLDRKLSIGLNGTLSFLKGDFVRKNVTGNMDLGISTHPHEYVTVGLVAMSVLPVPDQFHTPGTLALGVHAGKDSLVSASAEAWYRWEDVQRSPWVVRAGLEGRIKDIVALRGGWNWDGERGNHTVSWGIGLLAKKMGALSYAMEIPAVPGLLGNQLTHSLSLTIFTNIGKPQEEGVLNWTPRSQR